jgi:tetratricopeptide (TPR) repeat protein
VKPKAPLPQWAKPLGLALLVILAHGRSVTNGFIWDDDFYVTANSTLLSVDGIRQIWLNPQATPQYYPLVHTTYWLEHRLWGLHPAGYHTVNVSLHAASSVVLWALLTALCVPGAWLGAALFAVHPVGVESVAWVTERKNVLSMLMALMAAWCWLRYRFGRGAIAEQACAANGRGADRSGQGLWLAAAIGLFTLALLSKTVSVMLVGILLIAVWWKTGTLRRVDAFGLLPMIAIGLPLSLLTVWLEKYHVGAAAVPWSLSWCDRIVIAGRASVFYAGKLFWPHPLAFFYPRWDVDSRVPWQWLAAIVVLATLLAAWHYRKTIGRAPAAVLAMYACGLFPALGFFDVYPFKYSFVADHFQYHAMPVMLSAVAAGASRWGFPHTRGALASVLLALLVALSVDRCGRFYDLETLYLDTLAKNPACSAAAHNLGSLYLSQGRDSEGEHYLVQGAKYAVFPDEKSKTHTTLAFLALRRGQIKEALVLARTATGLDSTSRAKAVLALALVRSGNAKEAEDLVANAGHGPSPYMHLVAAECAMQRNDIQAAREAMTAFVDGQEHDKRNEAILEAAVSLARHSFPEQAEEMLLSVEGDDRDVARAFVNIGICRAMRGDLGSAARYFRDAIRHDDRSAVAHGNLGRALVALGLRDEALAEFEISRALSPRNFQFQRDYEEAHRRGGEGPKP